jgi:hypothetical protein
LPRLVQFETPRLQEIHPGSTVVDLAPFARAATEVKSFRQANARATVLSATERALGARMPR